MESEQKNAAASRGAPILLFELFRGNFLNQFTINSSNLLRYSLGID
jgi:hypothetical protein